MVGRCRKVLEVVVVVAAAAAERSVGYYSSPLFHCILELEGVGRMMNSWSEACTRAGWKCKPSSFRSCYLRFLMGMIKGFFKKKLGANLVYDSGGKYVFRPRLTSFHMEVKRKS